MLDSKFRVLFSRPVKMLCLSVLAVVMTSGALTRAAEPAVVLPLPAIDMPTSTQAGEQIAVLAGGCFWGVQAVYQHSLGVSQAVSGYSGGTMLTATYQLVSAGKTTHAEAVQIKFDARKISYGKILQIFFSVVHDPTQLNRQGPDVGPQYRSAIFFANADQQRVAEAYIKQLDELKVFKQPIVTRVDSLTAFYPAEAYHQDYATRHPDQPYIAFHDRPKIENLKRVMPDIYRAEPVLVGSMTPGN